MQPKPLKIAEIILLVAVVVGGIWLAKKPNQTVDITPTPSVGIDTTGWKIYTNIEYGFEFKYPASWQIKEKNAESSIGQKYVSLGREEATIAFIPTDANISCAANSRPAENPRDFTIYYPPATIYALLGTYIRYQVGSEILFFNLCSDDTTMKTMAINYWVYSEIDTDTLAEMDTIISTLKKT